MVNIYLSTVLQDSIDSTGKVQEIAKSVVQQYHALSNSTDRISESDLHVIKKMLRLSDDLPKHIYPMIAHRTLVYGLYSTVYQPSQAWYKLTTADGQDTPSIRRALDYLERSFSRLLAHSHYYSEALKCMADATAYGYAVLYEAVDDGKLRFQRINPDNVVFDIDANGEYSTVIRKMAVPAWQMEHLFKMTPAKTKQLAKTNPFKPITVYHAVFRQDTSLAKGQENEYGSIYVLDNPRMVLRQAGYRSNPYIVWIWSTRGDKTPTSPSWDALPALKKLDSISDSLLKASQLSVEPPLNTPAEILSKVQWKPRALLPYYSNNRTVQPAVLGINYPVGKEREDAIIQMIRSAYHVDFFLLMASLEGKGRLTATQVLEMQGEKAGILGAVTARMNKEFIEPMFDRLFELSIEEGWVDKSLADVKEIVEIDFQGILAQAQKRYSQVVTQIQAFQQGIPIIQLNPQVADNIDWDKLYIEILRESGLKERFFKDKKIVEAIRQARAKAEAQAQQLEQYKNYADAESKMSKAKERQAESNANALNAGLLGGI